MTMLNRQSIESRDSQHMLSSIEVLDKQCEEAWKATSSMQMDASFSSIDRLVFFGMGGSALGIDIVKSVFSNTLSVPVEVVNDYTIPAFVNERTGVILSSYSGTTEEVLSVSKSILEKTKNIIVMTTGGELATFAETHHLPAYIFTPTYNPSQQPRMAVGYAVMGTIGILASLQLLTVSEQEITAVLEHLRQCQTTLGADVPEENNTAKQFARSLQGKIPVFISSEFLIGSTHVLTNQVNENSKQFAVRFPIPEMNHHLIEGLSHPTQPVTHLSFVFIVSQLYHERNQKRHQVTAALVEQNHIAQQTLSLQGTTPLQQACELLLFGSYVSFYLAILNELDPSPIPNVDFLKKALA